MKFFNKFFLILVIYTAIILLFFSGLYIFLHIFYFNYFQQNTYEWYSFGQNDKAPSKIEIILSGFKSPINFLISVIISVATCTLIKILTRKFSERRWINIIFTCFTWTIILGFTYSIFQFAFTKLLYRSSTRYSLDLVRGRLPILMTLYCVLIFPMIVGFYKKIIGSFKTPMRTT